MWLQDDIEKLDNEINWYLALPIFEFLFSIENVYAINKEICAFSFEYTTTFLKEIDFMSVHDNSAAPISLFYDNFLIKPIDGKGEINKSIDWKGLGNIGRCYDELIKKISKHKSRDRAFFKKYKECIELIFSDFKTLKTREDRFDLYKKHIIGKMPENESIIDEWKKGNFCLYLSKEKIELLKDNETYLNDIEREKNKCIFFHNYALLKEILTDYDCISEFKLIMHLFPFNGLEIENAEIIYNESPESEVHENIKKKINNLPHCKYPIEVANFAGQSHFIVDRTTTIKDTPLMSYMNIKDDEANLIMSKIEKNIIMKTMNYDIDESKLENKKRL